MSLKDGLIKKISDVARSFEHASAAILFGSVARGDYDRRSDIDLLLIYTEKSNLEKDKAIFDEVSSLNGMDIQIVARTLEDLEKSDKVFLRNVLREGIILYVREPSILRASDLLRLIPCRLYIYSMKNLEQREKKKLISALYGYSTKKVVGRKEYRYEYRGLADMKLGRNCILVEETKAGDVEKLLASFGVEYRSIKIWVER